MNLAEEHPAAEGRILELEDNATQDKNDTPQKKNKILGSYSKSNFVFKSSEKITIQHFQEQTSDLSPKELDVCMMIANVISPYMSLPRHRIFFQNNIPFFLMANTIFRAIGQTKRIASLCPLTSPSQLNALRLDAPSLFSLFCGINAKIKPLNVHDFDGNVITTRQLATEQKDAMFSSFFFDLKKLLAICSKWKHAFGHYMVILPGAKTVRINNILDNASSANTCQPIKSQEEAQPSSSAFIPASPLAPNTNFLKQVCKTRGDFILRNKIKELKEQCVLQDKTMLNKTLREREQTKLLRQTKIFIVQIRRNRKQLDEDIYIQRNKLKKLRHDAYFLRNPKGQQPAQTSTKMITSEEYNCFKNVDNVISDGSILEKQDEVRFSGTDNGLVSIPETAPFF
ncbi:hypothetical protein EDC96DRAFT_351146 [Choanephora cucurbitarum]|nr:hypothetical protein EDC96DRAFT_351146 [Choanephora cucurbitarum]